MPLLPPASPLPPRPSAPRLPGSARARRFGVSIVLAAGVAAALLVRWATNGQPQHDRVRDWIRNGPSSHDAWLVYGGNRCADAPMRIPSDGFIGYGWDDHFYPGHRHTGFDIFSPDDAENVTPVFAAYDGLLTREADWRSAVIIRHPAFPADFPPLAARPPVGGVIFTYYAHMASADGATSFIAPAFPPGTHDRPVRAGELLGRQGTWSGDPAKPVGLHVHVSVVMGRAAATGDGAEVGYGNETDIDQTYDPAPFFGVARDPDGVLVCARWSPVDAAANAPIPTPGLRRTP
ncbi:MAG: hypothetical protein ABI780_05820 [Ardenticatenales bacterium]